MSLDTLLTTLERQADAEVARILTDAEAEAAKLTADADARIAALRAAAVERATATRQAALERELAAARAAARQRVLAARGAFLDRVFAAAVAALPALRAHPAYAGAMANDLVAALAYVPERASVSIRCAPGLEAPLRRAAGTLRDAPSVRVATDSGLVAGFIVVTDDGRVEVDASLATRLEQQRRALALAAVAALEDPT